MGEHTCQRWHRDHYCGRAIITYNLCGTEYTSEVGEVFAGFTGFFVVGDVWLGVVEIRWFCGFFNGFLPREIAMVKITTTWSNMFFLVPSILHANPKFWCVYLVFLVSQSLRKCPPKFRREDSGIMVVFFPPPRTKRGAEKRPSPNHLFIQRLRLWLLVSWRVRPYIIKGSWWFIIPEGAFLRAALVA